MGFQSMKKQGPPPWGMNQVGILMDCSVFSFNMLRVLDMRSLFGQPAGYMIELMAYFIKV